LFSLLITSHIILCTTQPQHNHKTAVVAAMVTAAMAVVAGAFDGGGSIV
jgi:hypothetical protein